MAFLFATTVDRRQAEHGPPAVFTVDADGELRLAPNRTRDAWDQALAQGLSEPFAHEACHCLFRDRATGWVQYVLTTSPALCARHARADVARYPSQEAALAALAAIGSPPLWRGAWPPR